jgi:flavin-dependent dehydrogenase
LASPAQRYDLVIVGGGPAGCAAAIAGRRRQLDVFLVEPQEHPQSRGCPGWVGPAGVRLCQELGVHAARTGAYEFPGLRLWPWDLSGPHEVKDANLAGWNVDPLALGAALLTAAQASGAHLARASVTALQLGEVAVAVQLSDQRTVTGSVLIIADGADSATAGLANFSAVRAESGGSAQALLDAADEKSGLDVILGAGRTVRVATIARHRGQVRVTLLTRDASSPATAQLAGLLANAANAGLLSRCASTTTVPVPCLAGAGLEFESHVGKRCLLVGDAGGFVSAFSNEGIFPALRSGWIAAETAARALSAPVLQDELATFSTAWRTDLADYLHMPNTDLGLLLPMVFNNPQMARRLAQAFLLGQPF